MSKIVADILRANALAIEMPMVYAIRGASKVSGRIDQRSTQALSAGSLNVSSIVDTGVALTQANFTSAMANAVYTVDGASEYNVTSYTQFQFYGAAIGSCSMANSPDSSNSFTDGVITFSIAGDLA